MGRPHLGHISNQPSSWHRYLLSSVLPSLLTETTSHLIPSTAWGLWSSLVETCLSPPTLTRSCSSTPALSTPVPPCVSSEVPSSWGCASPSPLPPSFYFQFLVAPLFLLWNSKVVAVNTKSREVGAGCCIVVLVCWFSSRANSSWFE